MKLEPNSLRLAIFILVASGWAGWAQVDVTVWDGPIITFTQQPGAGTSVRDQLTSGVVLTRDFSQGLFNVATEAAYTKFFSPQDTAWAFGSLENYDSLTYSSWQAWNGSNPPGMVGQPAVVHLISENIYLSLTFNSWGMRSPGGFSYNRSTPSAVPEPSVRALCGLSGLLTLFGIAKRNRRPLP